MLVAFQAILREAIRRRRASFTAVRRSRHSRQHGRAGLTVRQRPARPGWAGPGVSGSLAQAGRSGQPAANPPPPGNGDQHDRHPH